MAYFPESENDENWKMTETTPDSPIPERAIPEIIRSHGPIFGKTVGIEFQPAGGPGSLGRPAPDFHVRVSWQGQLFDFTAEAKTRNTPRVLEDALRATRTAAAQSGLIPMVIMPYLGEGRVERLLDEGVSGLDLCGNGLLVVPGRLMLMRTGRPNRYPESRPARFAYRGATSLVPRVFLRRAQFDSVGQVKDEIDAAGGFIALSTVSKALARMTEDLIIDRTGDQIVLLQPDTLLDTLLESFIPPKRDRVMNARMTVPLPELFRLAAQFKPPTLPESGLRLVMSGASSQDRYAAGMRADTPTIYCDDLDELRRRIGDAWQPTERYADLTVIETSDPTPYFDAQTDGAGTVYASPVQTYLELSAGGEKRDREVAQQVRAKILRGLSQRPGGTP